MPPATPHLDDACEDGQHVLVPGDAAGVRVCRHCGLDSATITDWLGHDVRYAGATE